MREYGKMHNEAREWDWPSKNEFTIAHPNIIIVQKGNEKGVPRSFLFENENIRNIILSEGLEYIGSEAFRNSDLQTIVVPSTVEEIREDAFSHCVFLEVVELNEGLKKIRKGAFSYCRSLRDIVIPSTVEVIERGAFIECSNLEVVVIKNGVQKISENAFHSCKNLKMIVNEGNLSFERVGAEPESPERCLKDLENLTEVFDIPLIRDFYSRVFAKTYNEIDNILQFKYKPDDTTIDTLFKKYPTIKEKLFYFGKLKLFGINYKQEYDEYVNNFLFKDKGDCVSLDKEPWYLEYIPGFIIQKDDKNVLDNKNKKIENVEESLKYNQLPNTVDEKYYNIGNDLYIKGKNGEDDDIMPKTFAKEFIRK